MNDPTITTLEQEFHIEMLDVYERAKAECKYDAKLFLPMVRNLGGRAAAKKLLTAPRVQSGFEKLWEYRRLDISMEARILRPKYAELFDRSELGEARKRLEAAGFDIRQCYD